MCFVHSHFIQMNVTISCLSSQIIAINMFDLSLSKAYKRQLAMKSFASLHLAPSSNLLQAASTKFKIKGTSISNVRMAQKGQKQG